MPKHSFDKTLIVVALIMIGTATIMLLSSGETRPGFGASDRDPSAITGDAANDLQAQGNDVVRHPAARDTREAAASATVVAVDRATGRPISGLSIRAIGELQPPIALTTGLNGKADLRPGSYVLESGDAKVEVLTKRVEPTGRLVTVVWCAYRRSFRLRVVDPQHLPVEKAHVSMRAASLGTACRTLGLTDSRGLLILREVPVEPTARLQVTRDGYYPGQFTLPSGRAANTVDVVIHPDDFEGGLELVDLKGRPHAGATVTALTADIRFSRLPPIDLGETDELGMISLPGDISDYKILRVDNATAYGAEIRNLRVSHGAFERIVIPSAVSATFRTTAVGCRWQVLDRLEEVSDTANSVVLLHRFLDAGDSTSVVSALPDGTPVNVHVWGDGCHGVRENVVAHGDGFDVFVELSAEEMTRTVTLVGQVDQLADFSIYSRGRWRSIALRQRGIGGKEVEMPVKRLTCRLTSIDGARLAAWVEPGNRDSVMEVVFPKTHRVRLRVVDLRGRPIHNVRITFDLEWSTASIERVPWRIMPQTRVRAREVDARGEAEVLLMEGEYRVTLSHLESGNLIESWRPVTGGVLTVPARGQAAEIVSLRPRLLKVHIAGRVPRRWNLVALPAGSFVTCFGRDVSVWQLGTGLTLEARRVDGTTFARGVSIAGEWCDHVTLYGL